MWWLAFTACSNLDPREEGTAAGDCSDAADNDGDGAFDCDDAGCVGSPDCVASPGTPTPTPSPKPTPTTPSDTGTAATADQSFDVTVFQVLFVESSPPEVCVTLLNADPALAGEAMMEVVRVATANGAAAFDDLAMPPPDLGYWVAVDDCEGAGDDYVRTLSPVPDALVLAGEVHEAPSLLRVAVESMDTSAQRIPSSPKGFTFEDPGSVLVRVTDNDDPVGGAELLDPDETALYFDNRAPDGWFTTDDGQTVTLNDETHGSQGMFVLPVGGDFQDWRVTAKGYLFDRQVLGGVPGSIVVAEFTAN